LVGVSLADIAVFNEYEGAIHVMSSDGQSSGMAEQALRALDPPIPPETVELRMALVQTFGFEILDDVELP
jgi:hypothetical protein